MSKKEAFGRKHNVAASVVTVLIMALVIVLYFQPQIKLSVLEDFLLLLVIEAFAFGFAYATSSNSWGRGILKILIYSAGWAFIITYVLNPANNMGFEINYFVVLVIQIVGYIVGFILL